jgi:hypothetical protein
VRRENLASVYQGVSAPALENPVTLLGLVVVLRACADTFPLRGVALVPVRADNCMYIVCLEDLSFILPDFRVNLRLFWTAGWL